MSFEEYRADKTRAFNVSVSGVGRFCCRIDLKVLVNSDSVF